MTPEQQTNLLRHADFLDKVVAVKFPNGIEMSVYYAEKGTEDRPEYSDMAFERWEPDLDAEKLARPEYRLYLQMTTNPVDFVPVLLAGRLRAVTCRL